MIRRKFICVVFLLLYGCVSVIAVLPPVDNDVLHKKIGSKDVENNDFELRRQFEERKGFQERLGSFLQVNSDRDIFEREADIMGKLVLKTSRAMQHVVLLMVLLLRTSGDTFSELISVLLRTIGGGFRLIAYGSNSLGKRLGAVGIERSLGNDIRISFARYLDEIAELCNSFGDAIAVISELVEAIFQGCGKAVEQSFLGVNFLVDKVALGITWLIGLSSHSKPLSNSMIHHPYQGVKSATNSLSNLVNSYIKLVVLMGQSSDNKSTHSVELPSHSVGSDPSMTSSHGQRKSTSNHSTGNSIQASWSPRGIHSKRNDEVPLLFPDVNSNYINESHINASLNLTTNISSNDETDTCYWIKDSVPYSREIRVAEPQCESPIPLDQLKSESTQVGSIIDRTDTKNSSATLASSLSFPTLSAKSSEASEDSEKWLRCGDWCRGLLMWFKLGLDYGWTNLGYIDQSKEPEVSIDYYHRLVPRSSYSGLIVFISLAIVSTISYFAATRQRQFLVVPFLIIWVCMIWLMMLSFEADVLEQAVVRAEIKTADAMMRGEFHNWFHSGGRTVINRDSLRRDFADLRSKDVENHVKRYLAQYRSLRWFNDLIHEMWLIHEGSRVGGLRDHFTGLFTDELLEALSSDSETDVINMQLKNFTLGDTAPVVHSFKSYPILRHYCMADDDGLRLNKTSFVNQYGHWSFGEAKHATKSANLSGSCNPDIASAGSSDPDCGILGLNQGLGVCESIVLDVDFTVDSDSFLMVFSLRQQDVRSVLPEAILSMKGISLAGSIQLHMQLTDDYPYLGNATYSFLKPPQWNIGSVSSFGGLDLTSVPGIHSWLIVNINSLLQQVTYPEHGNLDLRHALCDDCDDLPLSTVSKALIFLNNTFHTVIQWTWVQAVTNTLTTTLQDAPLGITLTANLSLPVPEGSSYTNASEVEDILKTLRNRDLLKKYRRPNSTSSATSISSSACSSYRKQNFIVRYIAGFICSAEYLAETLYCLDNAMCRHHE